MRLTGLDLTDKDVQVYEKGRQRVEMRRRDPPLLLPQLTLDLDPVFCSPDTSEVDTFFSKIDHVPADLQDGGTSLWKYNPIE
jgi:hypothetical protein